MLTTDRQVVDIAGDIDIASLKPTLRVALRSDSYTLHKILPNKVDPLVSLMMVEKVPDSTYEMVGGLDKQIKEIKEVIELPVKHPELFEALGIAQPKGVLLYGPPGTGKTLLARAVAHHTDCKFIRVSGSELVQKYIGEGSRMVRELFVMAREHAPSIIFMDEIDSIGSSRGESGSGGGDSEVQRTMLELLNQLDGFESTKNIKVIMATNRIGSHLRIFLRFPAGSLFPNKISLTRRYCAQGVLTGRSSSHRQDPRRVLPFSGSTPARFVWLV
jgi:26S proteasome regulatory subunit T6